LLFRRSLRVNFLLKLFVAMATLVFITSFSLYYYIHITSTNEIKKALEEQAEYLLKHYDTLAKDIKQQNNILTNSFGIKASIESAPYIHYQPKLFRIVQEDDHYYMQGFFPYKFNSQEYLLLTKDITRRIKSEKIIYKAMILVNIASLIFIIFYAFFLSKMLLRPINIVSRKIAKMNENQLNKIDIKSLPIEFEPLANSINQLINKIEHFLKYKKELFIGAAHELKTPLAVMKTKSQVALLKKDKSVQAMQDAIEQNIKSINTLNATIESILAFGREEGAQFEEAKRINIINYLHNLLDEFEIVAIKEEKYIIRKIYPKRLFMTIQPSLLRQVLQNLLQNAIRFSPKGEKIIVKAFLCEKKLIIRVKNKGEYLPKDFDIYAPFQRSKKSAGTGLGLFLAKNAANSLNATLELKNLSKEKGVVATFILKIR